MVEILKQDHFHGCCQHFDMIIMPVLKHVSDSKSVKIV